MSMSAVKGRRSSRTGNPISETGEPRGGVSNAHPIKMQFNPSPTELTTAATDVAIGVMSIAAIGYLWQFAEYDGWKVALWCWVLGVLAAAALLGAVAHGFSWSTRAWKLLWKPLLLFLGVTVSLFVVGAAYDWGGLTVARRALPVLLALAVVFFAVTQLVSGAFLVFVVYEIVAMLFALGVYGYLSMNGTGAGMGLMAFGVALNIAAAVIQATRTVSFTLIWPFDHNGVFHIVQMVALVVLVAGLRVSLLAAPLTS